MSLVPKPVSSQQLKLARLLSVACHQRVLSDTTVEEAVTSWARGQSFIKSLSNAVWVIFPLDSGYAFDGSILRKID